MLNVVPPYYKRERENGFSRASINTGRSQCDVGPKRNHVEEPEVPVELPQSPEPTPEVVPPEIPQPSDPQPEPQPQEDPPQTD